MDWRDSGEDGTGILRGPWLLYLPRAKHAQGKGQVWGIATGPNSGESQVRASLVDMHMPVMLESSLHWSLDSTEILRRRRTERTE